MRNYKNPSVSKISFQSLVKNLSGAPKLSFGSSSLRLNDLVPQGTKSSTSDPAPRAISFGSPSFKATSTSQSANTTSSWSGVLGGGSGKLGKLTSGLLGGLGIGPLLSGALGLFGSGSSSKSLPALQRFALPSAQNLAATIPHAAKLLPVQATVRASSSVINTGMAPTGATPTQRVAAGGGISNGGVGATAGNQSLSSGHQVHVHVSAMDTQSFMDRSNDIAKAVKSALLQSNSLNDVISEI